MDSPVSNASVFFQKIVNLGSNAFEYLSNLAQKSAKTEENEWCEFKSGGFIGVTVKPARAGKAPFNPEQKLKAIWSECLGAFANSGGGILVWGIKAPNRIAEGVDFVADAKVLEERLINLANDAVDPPILGVEVLAVVAKSGSKGFVVCYVPPSDFAPHRSIWGDREYYLRSQDGNRSMQTALLRRMFYPHTSPVVVPIVRAKLDKGDGGWYHFGMTVDLKNRGSASAEEIAIQLSSSSGYKTYPRNGWTREEDLFRGNFTIHPDQTVSWLNNVTNDIRNWQETGLTLAFTFRVFARNAPALGFELSFGGAELVSTANSNKRIEREAKLIGS
jgi:hypothetical protein